VTLPAKASPSSVWSVAGRGISGVGMTKANNMKTAAMASVVRRNRAVGDPSLDVGSNMAASPGPPWRDASDKGAACQWDYARPEGRRLTLAWKLI